MAQGGIPQMSLGIQEILETELADRSARFVFPSEICAADWLGRALRLPESPRALEAERFLGWDRLKEMAAERRDLPPVDDAMRRIFAARALADNEASPYLAALIPPEFAAEWQGFAGYIAARLPALGALPAALRAAQAAGQTVAGDARLADWLALRERYEGFLKQVGRFEPSFEPKALRELPGRTIIFFPELIEDFEGYAPSLASCPSVKLVPLPPVSRNVELRRPETAIAEIRETLSEIGGMLDRGDEAADIAVTVADLGRYRPYLEREAKLLSVPLALRSGQPLSATPGGRLFAAIRDLKSTNFSFDSMRDLLLSPAWPWKGKETARDTIRQGMKKHAVASWLEDGRQVDVWMRSLEPAARKWYSQLKNRILAITDAVDFASLLKFYNVFRNEILSTERDDWDPTADLTLARCVEELRKLALAEKAAGMPAPGAFGLFMHKLDTTQYVGKDGEPGVSVYDWRVGAAVYPKRHFVLGSSQDAMVAVYRGYDFLGESLRDALGSGRDAAADFIGAYALSGEQVSFSCPVTGFDGEAAAHGRLVSLSGGDSTPAEDRHGDPSYRAEADWLAGRGATPARLHAVQLAGLAASGEALPARAGEGASLGAATADAAAALLCREGETSMSLDATAIDYYHGCPYKYLYLRVLGAGAEASGIAFVDDFFIGDVYHATLELLFERIKTEDGRVRPERAEAYRDMIGACLGEAFSGLAAKRGPFVAVVLESYRDKLEAYLSILLETEVSRFPNRDIVGLEAELELRRPELARRGVVLRGRIDRITRSEEGALVFDYKKARIPERAQVAPDPSGAIAEAQIPCYLRLVTARGESVDSAWYLSIEGYGSSVGPGQAVCAFGDQDEKGKGAYVGRQSLDRLLEAFDAALRDTAQGIEAGGYPLADKEAQREVCRDCGARGICRDRYALRFGSAGRAVSNGGDASAAVGERAR